MMCHASSRNWSAVARRSSSSSSSPRKFCGSNGTWSARLLLQALTTSLWAFQPSWSFMASSSPWPYHSTSYVFQQQQRQQQRRMGSATSSSSSSSTTITTTIDDTAVAHMLHRIRQVNDMPAEIRSSLWKFEINGVTLGKVRPNMAQILMDAQPNVFVVADGDGKSDARTLTLSSLIEPTCKARTDAVARVMETLREEGVVRGWRNERYPIAARFGDTPLLHVERAAVPCLGALEYGVHMNGLVQTSYSGDRSSSSGTTPSSSASMSSPPPSPPPRMWMARRAADKSKYPGMLDHIAAGGQPVGWSLWENAIKECGEEAGIPPEMAAAGLQAVGAVSYETYSATSDTVTRAVLFIYDLYLPPDFVPAAVDGEVQEFFTWSLDDLVASMDPDFEDPLKPNCYLPVIDWMLRQGYVSPDAPGYLDVLRELRSGDCQ